MTRSDILAIFRDLLTIAVLLGGRGLSLLLLEQCHE